MTTLYKTHKNYRSMRFQLMKNTFHLLLAVFYMLTATAQTEITSSEAKTLYANTTKNRVSIHDPSVTFDEVSNRYYIFGSHKAGAYSTDLKNWTMSNPTWSTPSSNNAANADAFVTPEVTKIEKGGVMVDFPAFNASYWSARTDASYNIDGNMWAPDIIYNPTMNKWCYYLSINGDAWHSSIVLLTADNITGPYRYQGPVVTCGFYDSGHSYKDTDLEIVIGTQASLPSRYNVGSAWGKRWPHTIDPVVFYDEEGKLWMAYGSWSGGIWMLELDEQTGLRDYNVTYPSINGSNDLVSSDPYFGKKVAGGLYVSGEGPYIEHIGNYYYLFVSYGFYSPDGGYEMRVFRSERPDGPYMDSRGVSAIFTTAKKNYGIGGDTRGEKILGAYNKWGFMTVGECAQGHNSIMVANDGKAYLIYHTKFNDGTAGHQVRVHQLFVNKVGWLVAAPFEYNGESINDNDIASNQPFSSEDIIGTFNLLIHKYGMDYENYEEMTPVKITLTSDGKVSGAFSGTWEIEEGTGYFNITLGNVKYSGVIFEEVMDQKSIHTVSFTACSQAGANIWGYKMHPKYELAWQLNNQKVPIYNSQNISRDIDLAGMSLKLDNVRMTWSSSRPDIISPNGKYNPTGLADDTPVTLTARLEANNYFWEQTYQVTALSEAHVKPASDWSSGMIAHYGFDDAALENTFDKNDHAQLLRNGNGVMPVLENGEPLRVGKYVHLFFGANGYESYVKMPNPLMGQALEEGATISFWLKRSDNNLWDAFFGFVNGTARLYMTGNTYVGFNDGNTSGVNNWIDINHPSSVTPTHLEVGKWHLVTLVFAKRSITLYVDGSRKSFTRWNGSCNGKNVTSASGFDYDIILDHLSSANEFYLGRGSFWGSPDVLIDDMIVYNHPLSYSEVIGLNQIENRYFDFSTLDFLLGDVDEDGQVSIADVMALVQHILGSTPSVFNYKAADANGDNQLSIADVSAIVGLILTGNSSQMSIKSK